MKMSRTAKVEQSTMDFLREQVFSVRGLPETEIVLRDAFQFNRFGDAPLDKEYIAVGFNFDNGRGEAEVGSDLRRKQHTIEFWVLGTTPERGGELSAHVEYALDVEDGRVPLKDYTLDGDPVTDYLIVDNVIRQRQPHPQPQPWQENAWTVTLKVEDTYYASAE